MTTTALLDKNPNPTQEEVRDALAGNYCRCISQYHVFEAIDSLIGRAKRSPHAHARIKSINVERAKEEGVQIMPQWGVKRALYKDGQVTGMELKRTFYTRDEKGKLVLHYDEDETTIVNADSVLMAAGQQVDLSFLGDYASARGRLVVDEESQATSHSGVYAGGDIVSGPSTVISAIRQGRNAADLSPVLAALGATVKTTKRELTAAELFTQELKVKDKLEPDEIVTEVSIPVQAGAAGTEAICARSR